MKLTRFSVGTSLARSDSDTPVTAAIRHKSRAIASESGTGKGTNPVKLLRPSSRRPMASCERFEAGGSVERYLSARAKLADSAVLSLLHIA